MRLSKEISYRLQWSFIICAMLIFLIGIVCLYSWQKQNQQIHYALEDYIPKIQAATRLDENLNALFSEFNELTKANNTQSRLSMKEHISERLHTLYQLSAQLPQERQHSFYTSIKDIKELLVEIDNALSAYHIVLNQLSETQTYISWLHTDFNQEISLLLQDISLQQNFLLDQLKNKKQAQQEKIYQTFNRIHQELDIIANLTLTENNIISAIDQLVEKNNLSNLNNNLQYLNYLKQSSTTILSESSSSMITLRQIIQELFNIGLSSHQLPEILAQYAITVKNLDQAIAHKDIVLNTIKTNLEQQVKSDHWQLIYFSNKVQSASNLSICIIIATIAIAILFILIFNQFYIRPKITSRLMSLNQSVIELSKGNLTAAIPVFGQDELGRIAQLLRESIARINTQTSQLEAEIVERILIEKNLRATQDDLIQAAKLAVVGQTVTTLAHEINQPLNALSIYLYTAEMANDNGQINEVSHAIEQSQLLITRIKNIINQLRTFSKRSNSDEPLTSVDLMQIIHHAWGIIALNKTAHLTLSLPDNLCLVLGNEIRYEQVFVNIFANSIDACANQKAHIKIDKIETETELILYIQDNGIGWPCKDAERLLMPFTSNKKIGLGIGLSLSQSIMQQNKGDLYIASTLNGHALIILKFIKS